MEDYTYKKSTCERYDIRLSDDFTWATITIDENGGLFNAQSDFGNYNYSWPQHGRKSFKHFILRLVEDKSYFLRKVATDDHYYQEDTEKAWKEEIIRARRENELNKEQARELWNEITSFDYTSSMHLQYQLQESDVVSKFYYEPWYSFEIVSGVSPSAHAFADIIMPILGDIISKEIKNSELE